MNLEIHRNNINSDGLLQSDSLELSYALRPKAAGAAQDNYNT